MQLQILCIVALSFSVTAIRVPVDGTDAQPAADVIGEDHVDPGSQEPAYYTSNEGNVDSYLFPPDPHKPEEIKDRQEHSVNKPATYLVPPSPENQKIDYYYNQPSKNDRGDQSDWLPIAKEQGIKTEPQHGAPDQTVGFNKSDYFIINNPVVVPPEFQKVEREKTVQGNAVKVPGLPINNAELFVIKAQNPNNYHHILRPDVPPVTQPNAFLGLPVPSRHLEPPAIGAVDEYALSQPLKYDDPTNNDNRLPSLPVAKIVLDPHPQKKGKVHFEPHTMRNRPGIDLDLKPPRVQNLQNIRVPTNLYPKKYAPFHTIPIPIGPFVDQPDERPLDDSHPTIGKKLVGKKHHGISKGKPSKPFQPYSSHHLPYPDENKIYLYHQQEQEKQNSQANGFQANEDRSEDNEGKTSPEPLTSETNFGNSGRNPQQALVRPIEKTHVANAVAPNERTEFRMHGMKGPHSYQFGYDTGKGKNRQFRFEERDNDGHVRGHYGYMDKHGKLRVVNYDADPKLGFRAEAPTDGEQE